MPRQNGSLEGHSVSDFKKGDKVTGPLFPGIWIVEEVYDLVIAISNGYTRHIRSKEMFHKIEDEDV